MMQDASNDHMDGMMYLSIRQPWAWMILHHGKDIENRTCSGGGRE